MLTTMIGPFAIVKFVLYFCVIYHCLIVEN